MSNVPNCKDCVRYTKDGLGDMCRTCQNYSKFIRAGHEVKSSNRMKSIYEIRAKGRDFCQTEGSEHYKDNGLEPIDLIIAKGFIEDFCLSNIIKYATRFKVTRNLDDLKKVSDYAHICAGVELEKQNA